jgi:hypothetical protein
MVNKQNRKLIQQEALVAPILSTYTDITCRMALLDQLTYIGVIGFHSYGRGIVVLDEESLGVQQLDSDPDLQAFFVPASYVGNILPACAEALALTIAEYNPHEEVLVLMICIDEVGFCRLKRLTASA